MSSGIFELIINTDRYLQGLGLSAPIVDWEQLKAFMEVRRRFYFAKEIKCKSSRINRGPKSLLKLCFYTLTTDQQEQLNNLEIYTR